MSFFEEVYEVCKKIPKNKVTTYGQIAFLIGRPKASRQVGYALSCCPDSLNIPCHRVVNRKGELCNNYAFGHKEIQKQLLEEDNIEVNIDYTVDLKKYLWEI